MKLMTPILLMAVCAGALAQTAPTPATAADLMTAAKAKASAEKKSIFLKFEASW